MMLIHNTFSSECSQNSCNLSERLDDVCTDCDILCLTRGVVCRCLVLFHKKALCSVLLQVVFEIYESLSELFSVHIEDIFL
jgi:hypothetical protein